MPLDRAYAPDEMDAAPSPAVATSESDDAMTGASEHVSDAEVPDCSDLKDGQNYDQIEGMPPPYDGPSLSLCALVHADNVAGGGLYVVESLTGVRERDDVNADGWVKGFTYVKMRLIEPWFDADPNPEFRITGGLRADGSSGDWHFRLEVGKRVGVMYSKPMPWNCGYPFLPSQTVFIQRDDGGYGTQDLFTKRVVDERQLGEIVRSLNAMSPCGEDIDPAHL
jgi:hypothetical protein